MPDETKDAVDRQLAAYNDHDAEAFAECYADDVTIENPDGTIAVSGRDALLERYTAFFAAAPSIHAEIANRIRVGSYVIDEERVVGHPAGEMHAAVVYRIGDDGLIAAVRMLL
jgi:uncharacterized protein (TIGR02246 family)